MGCRQQGWSLALVGLMFALVQAGLTRFVVKRFGEERAIIAGLMIATIAYLSYGLATASWMLFATIVFSSFGGVAGPSLQSLVTRSVPANEQGAVQGALTSINNLAAIIGPLLYTFLFGYFTQPELRVQIPGIAFFTSASLVAIAVLLAFVNLFKRGKPQSQI